MIVLCDMISNDIPVFSIPFFPCFSWLFLMYSHLDHSWGRRRSSDMGAYEPSNAKFMSFRKQHGYKFDTCSSCFPLKYHFTYHFFGRHENNYPEAVSELIV